MRALPLLAIRLILAIAAIAAMALFALAYGIALFAETLEPSGPPVVVNKQPGGLDAEAGFPAPLIRD